MVRAQVKGTSFEEIIAASGAILDAMYADFKQLPLEVRAAMLCESGIEKLFVARHLGENYDQC
ncbi:MAG: hypothetical protein IJH04_02375 [Eggerthellaceae bacterium]|nr:hypothetical protein [Eggerthellaceae bacterium]